MQQQSSKQGVDQGTSENTSIYDLSENSHSPYV
jgi:hypothetical protein